MKLEIGDILRINGDNGQIRSVTMKSAAKGEYEVPCDTLLPFYGLTMKLGPIADWGIQLDDKDRIPVNTENFETAVPGIFCIGDMCAYPGKLKLILSGFHEAALMAQQAFRIKNPGERLMFQYTTSSSSLQKKLGVV